MTKLELKIQRFKEALEVDLANSLKLCLKELKEGGTKDSVRLLLAENRELEDYSIQGSIDISELQARKREIRSRVMKLFNKIEEDELILDRKALNILVICQSEREVPFMKEYFQRFGYRNVQVEVKESYEKPFGYDLIVFDNRQVSHQGGSDSEPREIYFETLMKEYLENSQKDLQDEFPPIFIHFGEYSKLLQSHRDKATAANSLFSLYARVKEVDEYLNTLRFFKDNS